MLSKTATDAGLIVQALWNGSTASIWTGGLRPAQKTPRGNVGQDAAGGSLFFLQPRLGCWIAKCRPLSRIPPVRNADARRCHWLLEHLLTTESLSRDSIALDLTSQRRLSHC